MTATTEYGAAYFATGFARCACEDTDHIRTLTNGATITQEVRNRCLRHAKLVGLFLNKVETHAQRDPNHPGVQQALRDAQGAFAEAHELLKQFLPIEPS